MAHTRIVLADNEPEILEAIAALLRDEFDIVASVENGEQAVEAVIRLGPDLLILDISMPVLNGIEAAFRLKGFGSTAKVIFVTVHEDPDYIDAAFSVGALGYILKHRLLTDLRPGITEVLQGRTFVSPSAWEETAVRRRRPILI
jgi:DNA-binding NarL/FixJ family response regulator